MASAQDANNGYIYDYVLDLVRKEKDGNTISIPRFNRYLYSCMLEFMEDEYQKWQQTQEVTDTLTRILNVGSILLDVVGQGTLSVASPNKYWHAIDSYLTASSAIEPRVKIDLVTKYEFYDRISSNLLFPTLKYPIATITGMPTEQLTTFKVIPYASTEIDVEYFYIPEQPFYDYYIDVNDNIIYLPEGTVHVWATGEVDSDGNTRTAGDPNYVSKSVELVFSDEDKMQIAYRILVKLGVNVKNSEAAQLGLRQEQKEEIA